MLVFSMGDRGSFEHLDKWMKECADYSLSNKLPLVLLGNKVGDSVDFPIFSFLPSVFAVSIQCEEKKAVTAEEAQKWARERGIQYVQSCDLVLLA